MRGECQCRFRGLSAVGYHGTRRCSKQDQAIMPKSKNLTPLAALLFTAACTAGPSMEAQREYGTDPQLVEPESSFFPTTKVAKAIGWSEGATPVAAEGLAVNAFARDLDHPRWMTVLPNGDVLVAESRGPNSGGGFEGIKGWIAEKMMAYAGSLGESADRVTLLRDTDNDGVADVQVPLLENLSSPFGMALVGDWLYIANAASLVRFPYTLGALSIDQPAELIVDLPGKGLNHHWTKNVIASPDGKKLYVAVGSNSNIGENGMAEEVDRAAILEVDAEAKTYRLFANGLRNPVGLDWNPVTGELWTAVNERDELGDQLVPDYITSVTDGEFFGWPYSYWGDNPDVRVEAQNPHPEKPVQVPDYALGAHTASLGLAFYTADRLPGFKGSAVIGQHGSWNRNPRSGYKVIAVPFNAVGEPEGLPMDVLTGFLNDDEEAQGRPAGVAVDSQGAILVADDVGNSIWRVVPAGSES
ncbi:L-sorbosone dehydrogenase [Luminiphilus syltensis NOR5-1B]|uniref:L-sorbosone dehydrogenase n=2 Tax=Luminiphilus TaxID=1341118 RepID=B8KV35_9GAMM|nr:L-sorbosone dehydrogenase [Luminiphilus syltensis NOR5-1B]